MSYQALEDKCMKRQFGPMNDRCATSPAIEFREDQKKKSKTHIIDIKEGKNIKDTFSGQDYTHKTCQKNLTMELS